MTDDLYSDPKPGTSSNLRTSGYSDPKPGPSSNLRTGGYSDPKPGPSNLRYRLTEYSSSSDNDDNDEEEDDEAEDGSPEAPKSPRKRKTTSSGASTTTADGFSEFLVDLERKFPYPRDENGVIKFADPEFDWVGNLERKIRAIFPDIDNFNDSDSDSDVEEPQSDTEYEIDGATWEKRVVAKKIRKDPDKPEKKKEEKPEEEPGKTEKTESDEAESEVFKRPKHKCRKFTFKPFKRTESGRLILDESKDPVDVVIPEQLAASYGLYIWPSSPVLGWFIWLHQDEYVGKNVLELGAGTSLPGLLCANIGANHVTLSDNHDDTLENISEAVKLNKLGDDKVSVISLPWGLFYEEIFRFKDNLDFIIGSDIFFDPSVFEDLVATISFLLDHNPRAKFYTAVQDRSNDWSIEEHLIRFHLKADYIYPKEFLAGTGIDEIDLIGGHTIYIMTLCKTKD